MSTVSVTELRQNLPAWLKRAESGEEIQITSRGRTVARLVPHEDRAVAAQRRLDALRGTVIVGDIMEPLGEEWTGDVDHL